MARALSRFLCVLAVMAALVRLAGGAEIDGVPATGVPSGIEDGGGATEGVCGRDDLVAETWVDCSADLHGSAVSDGDARRICGRHLAGIDRALGTVHHDRASRGAYPDVPDATLAQAPESGPAVVSAVAFEGDRLPGRTARPAQSRTPAGPSPSPPLPPPKLA